MACENFKFRLAIKTNQIPMKKSLFFILFLSFIGYVYAQQPFKYVIIPTQFPEIGKGFNPYSVSSVLQKILNEKGMKSVFETDQRPADYCEALNVVLEKTSSMFTNKLLVQLRDCQNNVIWSHEGVGRSKDFTQGYAEAIADAMSDFSELPQNRLLQNVAVAPATVPAPASVPEVVATTGNEEIYKPQNLYFNETYFVDLVSESDNLKKLLVINGKLLGYDKLQQIATLTSTDLPGMYTAEWITPQGETLRGVANLADNKLTITLSSENKPVVITLMKQ